MEEEVYARMPEPWVRKRGRRAVVSVRGARRLVCRREVVKEGVDSSAVHMEDVPALERKMSMRLWMAQAIWIVDASAEGGAERSRWRGWREGEEREERGARLRPQAMTISPRERTSVTMARPIPEVAPVISQTRGAIVRVGVGD